MTDDCRKNVVLLQNEVSEDMVETLEHYLEKAKRGELVALSIAAQVDGSSTSTYFHLQGGSVAHLVCAIERLKLRLLTE